MAKYANYAWIIDTDYTEHLADHEPRYNEAKRRFDHTVPKQSDPADISGPRDVSPQAVAALKAGKGVAFQLWDDDGTRYYSGRFFPTLDGEGFDDVDPNGYEGDPLEDFGAPNAGCTEMTIKNGEGYIS